MEEKLLEALRVQYTAEIARLKQMFDVLSLDNRRLLEENRKLWNAVGVHRLALGYAAGEIVNSCDQGTINNWSGFLRDAEDSTGGIVPLVDAK